MALTSHLQTDEDDAPIVKQKPIAKRFAAAAPRKSLKRVADSVRPCVSQGTLSH